MVLCKFFQKGNCYYGNSCRFDHIYDSKYSYRAPQQESTRSSSVNSSRQPSAHSASAASALFRSAAQNTTFGNTSNHTFGPSQPARPSIFDRLGPQPSNVFSNQNQTPQAKSIFAQANQNLFQQAQPTNSIFQTNTTQNLFQTNETPNVFQSYSQPASIFQTHNQPPNLFQTNSQPNVFQTQNQSTDARSLFAQATQNVFGQATSANISQQSSAPSSMNGNVFQMNGNVFQTSNKPTSVFATHNAFDQNQMNEDDIYSKIEDLSPSDIQAFESEDFKLGFIPELPPTRALCVM